MKDGEKLPGVQGFATGGFNPAAMVGTKTIYEAPSADPVSFSRIRHSLLKRDRALLVHFELRCNKGVFTSYEISAVYWSLFPGLMIHLGTKVSISAKVLMNEISSALEIGDAIARVNDYRHEFEGYGVIHIVGLCPNPNRRFLIMPIETYK